MNTSKTSTVKKPRADKAEFKATEKKIPLEKIPELEKAAKEAAGEQSKPIGGQQTSPGQPSPPVPELSPEALRPTLQMLAGRWNQFLEAPAGDEKERYRWTQQDTDNLLAAMQALDAKYHFMGRWLEYMPELFAVIVVGGILAKLLFGARWKNAQKQQAPATAPAANPEPKAPTIQERIAKVLNPQQKQTGYDPSEPPELRKAAGDYMTNQTPAPKPEVKLP